jgi:hypothetical protein
MIKFYIYIDDQNIEYLRNDNGSWIPKDSNNCDYQKYLQWINDGNVPEPWEP